MSLRSRLEKLEAEARRRDEAGAVRFRVIVPPKMSRKEWQERVREWQRTGERVFTIDLDGAGVFDESAPQG